MLQYLLLYYHELQLVFAFVAGYGALLIWHLPRYRSLAVFFLFQAVLMLLNLTESYYRTLTYPFLLTPVFTLAKGPLLYLFIKSMVNDAKLSGWQHARHFLPMVLALPLTAVPQLVVMLGSLSQVGYLVASFHLLRRYHSMARSFRADADELQLGWLVYVFGLFSAQVVIGLVRLNLQPVLSPLVSAAWFSFDVTFLFGLCCFLLFKVVRQPPLYDDMLVYEQEKRKSAEGNRERQNVEAPAVFAGLEAVIVGKCLYRQPRLTVDDIARETGLQMKDISWAINLGSGRNFNEYINRLRIAEVKQHLLAECSSEKSLLELAFASGFNSKSTFNAVFKREVGMTPTQFVKSKSLPG